MDPIDKLQARNNKHNKIQKAERNEFMLTFPLALALAVIGVVSYFTFSFYLMGDNLELLNLDFRGMAKHVWVLGMLFTLGFGAFFFVMSISFIIWFHLFAKELSIGVKTFGVFCISTTSLLMSSLFFFIARWLNDIILENRREISQYLTFGYNEAPFLFEMFSTYFIIGIAVLMLKSLHGAMKFPFKAKEHAKEHLTSQLKRDC